MTVGLMRVVANRGSLWEDELVLDVEDDELAFGFGDSALEGAVALLWAGAEDEVVGGWLRTEDMAVGVWAVEQD